MIQKLLNDGAVGKKNRSTMMRSLFCSTSLYTRAFCLQKFIRVVPIKDVRSLLLKFPIPDCKSFYKSTVSEIDSNTH